MDLGVLTGLISAWAGAYFSRRAATGKELSERRHRIYLMLLDLYHQHFWISTKDMHKQEITSELKEQFQKAKFEIMDALRTVDSLKQLMTSDSEEYWERRSKVDPFSPSRAARQRLSSVDASDEDDIPEQTEQPGLMRETSDHER